MSGRIRDLLYRYKPGILREYLLLVAGFAWLFTGMMLLVRGSAYVILYSQHKCMEVFIASIIGVLFYMLLFIRISLKHINRIRSKKSEKPCVFSFFDMKSYVLMAIMISSGIILRHAHIVDPDFLYTFYMVMGIPLVLSALSFFYSWYKETRCRVSE